MASAPDDDDRGGAKPVRDLAYPPDPAYGTGRARRLVRLSGSEGRAVADLSDTYHQMRVVLEHDGTGIAHITGTMARFPTTICPGAGAVLHELEGVPLATPIPDLYRGGRALRHCTHLFDLALLAFAQARRAPGVRLYEAVVPDETDAPVWIEIARDGAPVHRWQVRKGTIVAPGSLAGRPLLAGFAAWASQAFDEDGFEAALILERAWYIGRGRRYRADGAVGAANTLNTAMADACFAYAAAHAPAGRLRGDHFDDDPQLTAL